MHNSMVTEIKKPRRLRETISTNNRAKIIRNRRLHDRAKNRRIKTIIRTAQYNQKKETVARTQS